MEGIFDFGVAVAAAANEEDEVERKKKQKQTSPFRCHLSSLSLPRNAHFGLIFVSQQTTE